MNLDYLIKSADEGGDPPVGTNPSLMAMWLARANQWDQAHDLCQEIEGVDGAWIHAYLHRVEGDLGNASYWYSVAGKNQPHEDVSFDREWIAIVEVMLKEYESSSR